MTSSLKNHSSLINRRKYYIFYSITILLNFISFLMLYFVLLIFERPNKMSILIMRCCSMIILIVIIILSYKFKIKDEYSFRQKFSRKILIFLWKMTPLLEMIFYINFEFREYIADNRVFWLIFFRLTNFIIKIFSMFFENFTFEGILKIRIYLNLIIVTVFINIYVIISMSYELENIILIMFELCHMIYTIDRLTYFVLKRKKNLEDVFSNFLDFEHEGILIIKQENNNNNPEKNYIISYYNQQLLELFDLKKNVIPWKFNDLDKEIQDFHFLKFKHQGEKLISKSKEIEVHQKFDSLSNILSFYQEINKFNDFSLNFIFMRGSEHSKTSLPRLKLHLKKVDVDNELYFYLTFTKIENILNLKEKDEYKNRLLNAFNHEIRTPLNGSIPTLEELRRQNSTEENLSCIDNAIASLKILENSLNNFSDLSLISYDQLIINLTKIDIKEVLKEIFMIVKSQIYLKNLNLSIDVDDNLLDMKIITDYRRLKQMILNLLLNSIQFTFEGSINLKLKIQQENPKIIKFVIEDTGIGINHDKLENLRHTLKDVEDNEVHINASGSCLGLTITQKLSVLLGNKDLKIESTLNKGTKVNFSILDQSDIDPDISKITSKRRNNEKQRKNFLSIKNQNIMEFSKYISSIRNQNLMMQNSLKVESLRDLSSHEESLKINKKYENHFLSISTQLNRYNFDQLKNERKQIIKKIELKNSLIVNHIHTSFKTLFSIASSHSLPEDEKKHNNCGKSKFMCKNNEILLVDDDAFNLFSFEMILKGLNIKCQKAMNGKQALEKLKKFDCKNGKNCKCGYKMIFMDFQMPLMNGRETTIEIIKMIENNEISNVPIIGCTAFTTKNEILDCLNAGMKDVIFKPVSKNSISNILNEYN